MTLHIHPNEFAQRRQQLMQQIGTGNIGILSAAPEFIRNGDTHYPFRQDSNFYYLTGFAEPDAFAVFIPGRPEGEYVLFSRPHDAVQETWNGRRAGQDGAKAHHGAQQAFPISEYPARRAELFAGRQEKDIRPLIAEMRLFKSEGEIRLMRKAAEISVHAHRRAMQICNPGLKEYELEAEFLHEFTRSGCRAVAYPSIVASGINACTLHHVENESTLRDGDLILIDAGCEYQYYASDITRTFPVNGRFTEQQREIYNIVLAAQLAGIAKMRPGTPIPDIQRAMVDVIIDGLIKLGLLQEADRTTDAYKQYYMHGGGHWLGIDVHDVGAYRVNDEWRTLAPGMVMTVEPGIYIASLGIGIRIEDDVLVTADGHEVLTGALAKTVTDIESLMARTYDV